MQMSTVFELPAVVYFFLLLRFGLSLSPARGLAL